MDGLLNILASIGFDPKLAFFNLLNFLLVLIILKVLIFDRVGSVIEQRRKTVLEGIENSKLAETELAHANKRGEEIVAEAKKQGDKIIEQASQDAIVLAERVKKDAEREITKAEQKSLHQIEIERERSKQELHEYAVRLVVQSTEKVIDKKLDVETDNELIRSTIDSLKVAQ